MTLQHSWKLFQSMQVVASVSTNMNAVLRPCHRHCHASVRDRNAPKVVGGVPVPRKWFTAAPAALTVIPLPALPGTPLEER